MSRVGRWTIRARATCLAAISFTAILLGGSLVLVHMLEAELTQTSDDLATSRISDLLDAAAAGRLPASLATGDDNAVAQVVDSHGRVLAASPNIAGRPRISDAAPGDGYSVDVVRAPDDDELETYRLWAGSATTPDGEVVVYVGSSLESVSEATSVLRRSLWVGVPLAVLVLTVATWLLIGRVLRRLDAIRAEVDRIGADDLGRRVDGGAVSDEVGRLAATMNRMLDRVEDGVERQRRFVADVSHDLQSPLAGQRLVLELALPDAGGSGSAMRDALAATTDMEALVADLLVLARLDASLDDGPARAVEPVDLDDIVLEEAMRARAATTVEIDTSAVSAAPVRAEPTELRRLVRNLLDNAVRHAATGVQLSLVADDLVVLDVVDDGPGIAPADHDRVFDRFFRADEARTRASGSGLGLPIARAIARGLGGDVAVEPSTSGAHLRVVLPC